MTYAPLKTSASKLRMLQNHLSTTEKLELTDTIESEADHLDTLIGNLLDLLRLQAGAMTLNNELNSLEEVAVVAGIWQKLEVKNSHGMDWITYHS